MGIAAKLYLTFVQMLVEAVLEVTTIGREVLQFEALKRRSVVVLLHRLVMKRVRIHDATKC